jgi:hypothetical protein
MSGIVIQRSCARVLHLLLCMSSLTALLYPYAAPAATCETPVAKVVSVQGTVESQRLGETQWQPVQLNDTYCPGDMLRVQERSRADVAMLNQSVLQTIIAVV